MKKTKSKTKKKIEPNPLLNIDELPQFGLIKTEHIQPAIDQLISENMAKIKELVSSSETPNWNNFIQPLEELDNKLEIVSGLVKHLNDVKHTDDFYKAYLGVIEKLTNYYTQLGQNKELFNKFKEIKSSPSYYSFSPAQKKAIENYLRDFRLSGIDLPIEKQNQIKEISQQLGQLTTQFSKNLLKSTQSWSKHITNKKELKGLPKDTLSLLKKTAKQRQLNGWVIIIDDPTYLSVMTYAENRALREEVYRAYITWASDQALDKRYDNSAIIKEILKLRHQKALLLGFKNYGELSLETKTAKSTEEVINFLRDLVDRAKQQSKDEFAELKRFFKERVSDKLDFRPWDILFVSEKLKEATLSLSQEKLRPYFPIEKVLEGLFLITKTLFQVSIKEKRGISTWDKDVRFFEVFNEKNELIGQFYLDLYARKNKEGGAWADLFRARWKKLDNKIQIPVVCLVCNFTPPLKNKFSCLTHDEVKTLFHEFGHALHDLLTKVDVFSVSGSKVPWDVVEVPSQFMENFCWQKESLALISSHIESGETLPEVDLLALQKSRDFQSAMMMMKLLERGLFDFIIHSQYNPTVPADVLETINHLRKETALITIPEYDRFPHRFDHIFSGGYAAGYFSYLWSEVLSADIFSLFEERGILDSTTGIKFREAILEKGGSEDPFKLFKDFRGRKPKIDAFLRHSGIKIRK